MDLQVINSRKESEERHEGGDTTQREIITSIKEPSKVVSLNKQRCLNIGYNRNG
jgi:hypothetical protein